MNLFQLFSVLFSLESMVNYLTSQGGVLPYKRLIGMCRWMGSHFHDWSDYNGVANFRIFGVSRDSKWEDSRLKNQKVVVY